MKGVKKYKLPVIKQIIHRDGMYSLVGIINNIVYLKAVKRVKVLITGKNF